jgi:hypothetical protein
MPTMQPIEASAPPISQEEFEEALKQLENNVYNLNLALITYELEYLYSQIKFIENEINQTDTAKCDKQCDEANKSIEPNTVDDLLLNKINYIFK